MPGLQTLGVEGLGASLGSRCKVAVAEAGAGRDTGCRGG